MEAASFALWLLANGDLLGDLLGFQNFSREEHAVRHQSQNMVKEM